MQKATVACSIYIFDNPPWTEMNDETTGPPNHPNLSLSKDVENIWKQKHSAVGSTVKTWSLKSWEHLRTNICKYETITLNSDMWISLMRNLGNNGNHPRNPHFHSPSTCPKKSPRSTMNDETPAPPNHPNLSLSQDAGKVWESDIMTCRSIQRFCGAHPAHQAFGTNFVVNQTNARDGRVCLQRLGQGLETETYQGWRLHPGLYRSNRDHWNPENTWHLTLTSESLWYRTLQTKQKSTVAYSIYIFDVTTLLEQRWMMKRQDLQTIQTCHCQRMSKTYENKSIQRWALPSKPDHWNPENNICKYQ